MLNHKITIEGRVSGSVYHGEEKLSENRVFKSAAFDLVIPHKNAGDTLRKTDTIRCLAPEFLIPYTDQNIAEGKHIVLEGRFNANEYQYVDDEYFSENHILVDKYILVDDSYSEDQFSAYKNSGEIYGVLDSYPELEYLTEASAEDESDDDTEMYPSITRCRLLVENNDFNEDANMVTYAHIPCVAYGDLAAKMDDELSEDSGISATGYIQSRIYTGDSGESIVCPEFVITGYAEEPSLTEDHGEEPSEDREFF